MISIMEHGRDPLLKDSRWVVKKFKGQCHDT
jgi:hypothetical protein